MSHNIKNELIFQKEKEWRDLLVAELEESNRDKERYKKDCDDLRDKFNQLHVDFKHNLQLLVDRENDLNDTEKENEALHRSVCEYEEQISELSVQIERMREDVMRGDKALRDVTDKIERVKDKAATDVRVIREEKLQELERVRSELGNRVRELECALLEADERINEERRDRDGHFEEKDKEIRKDREEANWRVVQHEMKYRLASKELEICRSNKAELMVQIAEKDESIRNMELRIGEMELAVASEISILQMRHEQEAMEARETQIKMEKEIERLSRKVRIREEAMQSKVSVAKRLEVEMRKVLDQTAEKERSFEREIEVLKEEITRMRDVLEEEQRVLGGKDSEIARLVARMTEEVANRDGELRNVKFECDALRKQVREKQEQLLELRNELEYAVGRDIEDSRRRECDKEALDSRLEKVRVEEMAKVEGIIKALTRTRDEALAEVRELRRQNDDRKEVRICTKCSQNPSKETSDMNSNSEELKQMRAQNEQLKEVISRMTEEATNEITNIPTPSNTNNKHISILAERNRQLQQEKIDLLANSRKVQARYEGMETENSDMKRIVRERETEISQIRFELDSLKRHSDLDNRTLRRRVQELETELEVGRKESAEYYKGNLELGRIVEDLQAELTFLKSEDFGKVPSLNFGAQEMIIEQLKKEISDLRCRLNGDGLMESDGRRMEPFDESREIKILRGKLKMAANYIKDLAKEKQVLIQLSNRLRSELKHAGVKIVSDGTSVKTTVDYKVDHDQKTKNVSHTIDDLESKLSQLERLQRDTRVNYDGNRRDMPRSARDAVSSLGGQSVEDVFRLLDDSDSLGKSSVCGQEPQEPHGPLWARTVRLNPAKVASKRNMIINRK